MTQKPPTRALLEFMSTADVPRGYIDDKGVFLPLDLERGEEHTEMALRIWVEEGKITQEQADADSKGILAHKAFVDLTSGRGWLRVTPTVDYDRNASAYVNMDHRTWGRGALGRMHKVFDDIAPRLSQVVIEVEYVDPERVGGFWANDSTIYRIPGRDFPFIGFKDLKDYKVLESVVELAEQYLTETVGVVNWSYREPAVGLVGYQRNGMLEGYRAYTVSMTAAEYLRLNPPPESQKLKKEYLVNAIQSGEPIAPPFIETEWEGNEWRVVQHEGRTRSSMVARMFGPNTKIPVTVLPGENRQLMKMGDFTDEQRAAMYTFRADKESSTPSATVTAEAYDAKRLLTEATTFPAEYLTIGHHDRAQAWWMRHGDDDITIGEVGKYHPWNSDDPDRPEYPNDLRVWGQIDHMWKRISIVGGASKEDYDYAESILKMDYPDYKIARFESVETAHDEAKQYLTEEIKKLREYLKDGRYAVYHYGRHGWFDVYRAVEIDESFYEYVAPEIDDIRSWTRRVHEYGSGDIPHQVYEMETFHGKADAERAALVATEKLSRFGFPRQRTVAIITDLTEHPIRSTGEKGAAGLFWTTLHAIEINHKSQEDDGTWVHEWAHSFWKMLPKASKKLFSRWYDEYIYKEATEYLLSGITRDDINDIIHDIHFNMDVSIRKDLEGEFPEEPVWGHGMSTIGKEPRKYREYITDPMWWRKHLVGVLFRNEEINKHPELQKWGIEARFLWDIPGRKSGDTTPFMGIARKLADEMKTYDPSDSREPDRYVYRRLRRLLHGFANLEQAKSFARQRMAYGTPGHMDTPWHEKLRKRAAELRNLPSAYAATNPGELFSVLVDYALDRESDPLSRELRKLVVDILSGANIHEAVAEAQAYLEYDEYDARYDRMKAHSGWLLPDGEWVHAPWDHSEAATYYLADHGMLDLADPDNPTHDEYMQARDKAVKLGWIRFTDVADFELPRMSRALLDRALGRVFDKKVPEDITHLLIDVAGPLVNHGDGNYSYETTASYKVPIEYAPELTTRKIGRYRITDSVTEAARLDNSDSDLDVWATQDRTAEKVVHRRLDPEAMTMRERLENAGDILREFSVEHPDRTYIREKIRRIRQWMEPTDPGWPDYEDDHRAAKETNQADLDELRSAYVALIKRHDKTMSEKQRVAAQLPIVMIDGAWDTTRDLLDKIEGFLSGPRESVQEAKRALTYLDIGHGADVDIDPHGEPNGMPWVLGTDKDDVTYGEKGQSHNKFGEVYGYDWDAAGRVDFGKKVISIVSYRGGTSDRVRYAADLLRMDYPDYTIIPFDAKAKRALGKSVQENIEIRNAGGKWLDFTRGWLEPSGKFHSFYDAPEHTDEHYDLLLHLFKDDINFGSVGPLWKTVEGLGWVRVVRSGMEILNTSKISPTTVVRFMEKNFDPAIDPTDAEFILEMHEGGNVSGTISFDRFKELAQSGWPAIRAALDRRGLESVQEAARKKYNVFSTSNEGWVDTWRDVFIPATQPDSEYKDHGTAAAEYIATPREAFDTRQVNVLKDDGVKRIKGGHYVSVDSYKSWRIIKNVAGEKLPEFDPRYDLMSRADAYDLAFELGWVRINQDGIEVVPSTANLKVLQAWMASNLDSNHSDFLHVDIRGASKGQITSLTLPLEDFLGASSWAGLKRIGIRNVELRDINAGRSPLADLWARRAMRGESVEEAVGENAHLGEAWLHPEKYELVRVRGSEGHHVVAERILRKKFDDARTADRLMYARGWVRVADNGMSLDPATVDLESLQEWFAEGAEDQQVYVSPYDRITIDAWDESARGGYQSVSMFFQLFMEAKSWDQILGRGQDNPPPSELLMGLWKRKTAGERGGIEDSVQEAEQYLTEANIGHGEWWIDEYGTAEGADGDIGDTNHAMIAFESMTGTSFSEADYVEGIPFMSPEEPLSDEAVEYLQSEGVEPEVVAFLKKGNDPREWMLQHEGWIRLADTNAQLWDWNEKTLSNLRSGLFDAWQLDDVDYDDPDDDGYLPEVTIEEYSTHDTFAVPLKSLMDDRFDAEALRRLGATGKVTQVDMSDFMRAAWARKAAGERGIEDSVQEAEQYLAEMASSRDLTPLAAYINIELPSTESEVAKLTQKQYETIIWDTVDRFLPDYIEDKMGFSTEEARDAIEEAREDPIGFFEKHPEHKAPYLLGLEKAFYNYGDYSEVPIWNVMDWAEVYESGILVRKTDRIDKSDALMGWDEWEALAYTGMYHGYGGERVKDGWCFAFEYGFDEDVPEGKYGSDAIVLKAPYVRVYHHGDQEYQAIFPCAEAQILGHITKGSDSSYEATVPGFDDPIYDGYEFQEAVEKVVEYAEKSAHGQVVSVMDSVQEAEQYLSEASAQGMTVYRGTQTGDVSRTVRHTPSWTPSLLTALVYAAQPSSRLGSRARHLKTSTVHAAELNCSKVLDFTDWGIYCHVSDIMHKMGWPEKMSTEEVLAIYTYLHKRHTGRIKAGPFSYQMYDEDGEEFEYDVPLAGVLSGSESPFTRAREDFEWEQTREEAARLAVDIFAFVDAPVFQKVARRQGYTCVAYNDVFEGVRYAGHDVLGLRASDLEDRGLLDTAEGMDWEDVYTQVTYRPLTPSAIKPLWSKSAAEVLAEWKGTVPPHPDDEDGEPIEDSVQEAERYLAESFSTQKKRFVSYGTDKDEVEAVFQEFKQLKARGLLTPSEKDIDRYKTFGDLVGVVTSARERLSGTQAKTLRKYGTLKKPKNREHGATLVYEDANYEILKITTVAASIHYGKDTDWCISGSAAVEHFRNYTRGGAAFYFAMPKNNRKQDKYAVVVQKGDTIREVRDWKDNAVDLPEKLYSAYNSDVFRYFPPVPPDPKDGDVDDIMWHVVNVIKDRWPEAEARIATDAKSAAKYASLFMSGPFPEAEAVIAKDSDAAITYALEVLKSPWPEGEPAIFKDKINALNYAASFGGIFPEVERSLSRDPWLAYMYAKRVIGDRWPEGEAAIARNGPVAFGYAKDVLHDRFPAGEKEILKDPDLAAKYAIHVIGGRWPEGEPSIAKSGNAVLAYAQRLGHPVPEMEDVFLTQDPFQGVSYTYRVRGGRWPELEAAIKKNRRVPRFQLAMHEYTQFIMGGDDSWETTPVKDSVSEAEFREPTSDEIAATNITSQLKSPKMVQSKVNALFKHFVKWYSAKKYPGATVLDFGSGNPPRWSQRLRRRGWDVVSYDYGDNFDPDLHDARALRRKYDFVFASRVLNVQPSVEVLRHTLQTLAGVLKPDGILVANYPIPKKVQKGVVNGKPVFLSMTEFLNVVREVFPWVEKQGGDIFEAAWEDPYEKDEESVTKEAARYIELADTVLEEYPGQSEVTVGVPDEI